MWLPAPVVKHRGALSWKSKVQHDWMAACKSDFYFVCKGVTFVSVRLESGGVMVMKNHDENELPGPPSKPQVTDVTKNSVSLSWQPGLAGASPVSSYVIEAFRFVLPGTSKPSALFQ